VRAIPRRAHLSSIARRHSANYGASGSPVPRRSVVTPNDFAATCHDLPRLAATVSRRGVARAIASS